MNFKEEYKKSADIISPDKEAIDRMKAAVLAKAAEEPEESAAESRKPLPLKRIAIIGGAVAACAVITISAINLLPSISKTNNLVDEASSSSAASMAEVEIADSSAANDEGAQPHEVNTSIFSGESASAADDAEDTDIMETGAVCAASEEFFTAETEAEEAFPAEPSETGGQVNDIQTEQEEAQTVETVVSAEIEYGSCESADTTAPVFPEYPTTGGEEKQPGSDGVLTASEPDMPDEAQDAVMGETAEMADAAESAAVAETAEMEETAEIPVTDEAAYDYPDHGWNPMTGPIYETTDAETLESSALTEEVGAFTTEEATCEAGYDWSYEAAAPEDSVPKLVITGKGWLTYGGERYNEDTEIKPAETPELIVKAQNVMDKRDYYVNLDGDILTLYDDKKNFIGAYRKR